MAEQPAAAWIPTNIMPSSEQNPELLFFPDYPRSWNNLRETPLYLFLNDDNLPSPGACSFPIPTTTLLVALVFCNT